MESEWAKFRTAIVETSLPGGLGGILPKLLKAVDIIGLSWLTLLCEGSQVPWPPESVSVMYREGCPVGLIKQLALG